MPQRLALLGLVAAGLLLAWATGLLAWLSEPERVVADLRAMGVWGQVLYVVSFALLEPFFVPGVLFVVPASIVWPFPQAFALSLLGATGAGVVGFGFARFLAHDWVSSRLPAAMRRHDERLARNGLLGVIVVRLVFFLAPPAHWLLGVSSVRFGPFLLGTAIGFVPAIAGMTFVGDRAADWMSAQRPELWLALGAAAVALALARRRWRGRRVVGH